ncbi:MAG: tetratricopeptide repeat protein [Rhizobiales bacterium]|nr:tetratricopeptide repeat protein [Hyphomicrobiales bacterium]
MSSHDRSVSAPAGRFLPVAIACLAALTLGACSQAGEALSLAGLSAAPAEAPVSTSEAGKPSPREIQESVSYWGQRFIAKPGDEATAVAYSQNLRYIGEERRALAVLERAHMANGQSKRIASEYGRLALKLGEVELARDILMKAVDPASPDWRTLSALGASLAQLGERERAIETLERANAVSPNNPAILNNLALAHALSGSASSAAELLRVAKTASDDGETSSRLASNLAMVESLGDLNGSSLAPSTTAHTGSALAAAMTAPQPPSTPIDLRPASGQQSGETPAAASAPATVASAQATPAAGLRPTQAAATKAAAGPWSMEIASTR